MPSVSKKQHNFMAAIAHNPSFAKKVGVAQSVGQDFSKADKGKTFSRGGDMKESKEMVKKEVSFFKKKGAPASMVKHEEAEMKGMKKGGKVKRYNGEEDSEVDYDKDSNPESQKVYSSTMNQREEMPVEEKKEIKPKVKAKPKVKTEDTRAVTFNRKLMNQGNAARDVISARRAINRADIDNNAAYGMKKGGMARSDKDVAKDQQKMSNMATYARGGGIESRGKTKGTMVKMATGGVVKFARGGGIESRGKTRGKMC